MSLDFLLEMAIDGLVTIVLALLVLAGIIILLALSVGIFLVLTVPLASYLWLIPLKVKYGKVYWRDTEIEMLDGGLIMWWGKIIYAVIGIVLSLATVGYLANLIGVSPL